MREWNEECLTQRGNLLARLARSDADIRVAQQLRHEVFFRERLSRKTGIDEDRFDAICDHLLVIDTDSTNAGIAVAGGQLVGTYRLLRQEIAERNFGFYSQDEFDLAPLIKSKPDLRFLELGRSCVLAEYRSKNIVELLWQGIWNYVRHNRMDVMLGCASFEGADPSQHASALSFLAHSAAPPPEWNVVAHPNRHVKMKTMPLSSIDQRRTFGHLPPLIKGYLRLGCLIGEGAVIDHQFGTVDVLIILPVSRINPRYFDHFGQPIG